MTDVSRVREHPSPREGHRRIVRQQRSFRDLLAYVWTRSAFYRDYYHSRGIREDHLGRTWCSSDMRTAYVAQSTGQISLNYPISQMSPNASTAPTSRSIGHDMGYRASRICSHSWVKPICRADPRSAGRTCQAI